MPFSSSIRSNAIRRPRRYISPPPLPVSPVFREPLPRAARCPRGSRKLNGARLVDLSRENENSRDRASITRETAVQRASISDLPGESIDSTTPCRTRRRRWPPMQRLPFRRERQRVSEAACFPYRRHTRSFRCNRRINSQ